MFKKYLGAQKKISVVIIILVILGIIIGGYFFYKTTKELSLTKTDLENTKLILAKSEEQVKDLSNKLGTEIYKNSLFSGQISEITNTVGKLDKLSKTDKELLQKYSKIYFLNENYVPEDLTSIPPDYIFEKDKEIKIHTKTFPYLQDMIVTAQRDGINLKIISGFRSFGEQSTLKNTYAVTYGSGANKFSADQGFSEHQLGTAIDFTTVELGLNFSTFEKSSAYKWLTDNAYKFGFVISYPKGNSYYQYESWHWRFVGRSLAEKLHEENKNFYDLDQRTIDAYLINIFD